MKKEYDLYKEYEKIYLKGNINDKTDFEIYIEGMNPVKKGYLLCGRKL